MSPNCKNARIACAVSGGVDSLCALILLKKRNINVFAIHGIFFDNETAYKRTATLKNICRKLDVELIIADISETFKKQIIQPFINDYVSGYTPSPCCWCNKIIKFGALYEIAKSYNADFFATGHYAKKTALNLNNKKISLLQQAGLKDQTYFLSLLSGKQIEKAVFPIGNLEKTQCRNIVADAGIEVPEQKESQDICFIGQKNYSKIIKPAGFNACGPVFFKDISGKLAEIGRHSGLWNYTEGQRKGLNIPYREALYVIEKNLENNALITGTKKDACINIVHSRIESVHIPFQYWPEYVNICLRHKSRKALAQISLLDSNLTAILKEPQFLSAPGQIMTIYDDMGVVLAGAVISKCVMQQ